MQVWMKLEVLPPTVKYSEEPNLSSEVLGIRRNDSERLGRNSKKDAEDQLFILIGKGGNFLRHCKHDVKIADGQELSLAIFDPLCSSHGLTLRAVPVPAAIEAIPFMLTVGAALECF
jgi:hypothetical protein